jgi:hypothetical protein
MRSVGVSAVRLSSDAPSARLRNAAPVSKSRWRPRSVTKDQLFAAGCSDRSFLRNCILPRPKGGSVSDHGSMDAARRDRANVEALTHSAHDWKPAAQTGTRGCGMSAAQIAARQRMSAGAAAACGVTSWHRAARTLDHSTKHSVFAQMHSASAPRCSASSSTRSDTGESAASAFRRWHISNYDRNLPMLRERHERVAFQVISSLDSLAIAQDWRDTVKK